MPEDPFLILGLEARFDLDEGAIEAAYLTRAARTHPDLARADPDAPARAAALNRARQTLLDPEARAHALLDRLGVALTPDRSLPEGFLEEIMALRLRIEDELASEGDPGRQRWQRWAQERRDRHLAGAAAHFRALPARPTAADLAPLRTELNAWRYIERLLEQLEAS